MIYIIISGFRAKAQRRLEEELSRRLIEEELLLRQTEVENKQYECVSISLKGRALYVA